MNDNLIAYSEEIAQLFRSIQKKIRTYVLEQVVPDSNFTFPQLILIHELLHNPGITLNELSNRLQLAKSTVSGIVDRLETRGVVIRERPKENKRIVKIYLASKTLDVSQIKMIKTKYLSHILEETDIGEIENILQSLRKLDSLATSLQEKNN